MLKRFLLVLTGLISWIYMTAQSQSSIQLYLETGILWDAVESKTYLSGPFFNIEPKLKMSAKSVLGLRIGAPINTQQLILTDPNQFIIGNNIGLNGVITLGPAYNYYFNSNKFRPFLGIGIGYHILSTSKRGIDVQYPLNQVRLAIDNQIGLMLRTGFNLYRLRIEGVDFSRYILGFAFTYIPKAKVNTLSLNEVATVATSNFSISLGRFIGANQSY